MTITAKKSPTLRELNEERDVIGAWLLEVEGEETPEIAALWDQLDGEINEKIERWALWIQDRLATADAIKAEEKRLALRRGAIESACQRSKDELQRMMDVLGRDKVAGLLCTVSLQNNPPAVECTLDEVELRAAFFNEQGAPEGVGQFVVEKPATYRLDAATVKRAANEGEPLPPSIQITQGRSLRIR